ncbi:MAG: MFS transporter [Nocardioides sp.]|uniref:MFS transporter n=1 Tax=Nocardioides sp. TaxID=35761 RepID=UPI003EFC6765
MVTTHDITTPPPLRRVALPAFGPPLLTSIGFGAVLPVLPLHARALGASVGEAAALVALVSVGTLLMALPSGALISRVGERWAMTIMGVAEAALCLLAWRTDSLAVFAGVGFGLGMTTTVAMQARQGFLIDAFGETHRARAMSTMGGVFRIGLLLGPLVGAGLIHAYGLASVFALAALTALLSVLAVQTMPDLGAHDRTAGPGPSVVSVLLSHRRDLLVYGSAVAVIQGSRSLRFVLLPLWCEHVGLSAASTSLIVGIAAAVDVCFFYPAGWVMDHHGRAPVAFCVVVGAALGCLLLPLADTFGTVLAVACVIAVGNGMGSGIVLTMGADTAPQAGRAQYLGGWRLVAELGSGSAPLALGVLVAAVPLGAACLALGGATLAGAAWATGCARALDRRRAATR